MNITPISDAMMYNATFRADTALVTVDNCLAYTESLRHEIVAQYVAIAVLAIVLMVLLIRIKRLEPYNPK